MRNCVMRTVPPDKNSYNSTNRLLITLLTYRKTFTRIGYTLTTPRNRILNLTLYLAESFVVVSRSASFVRAHLPIIHRRNHTPQVPLASSSSSWQQHQHQPPRSQSSRPCGAIRDIQRMEGRKGRKIKQVEILMRCNPPLRSIAGGREGRGRWS